MDLMLSAEAFTVPRAHSGGFAFDMRKIHKAEARLCELCALTREKSGEFLFVIIEAWKTAKDHLATLHAEHARCKQWLREIRGALVLDEAPDLLKKLGLSSTRSPAGSEDLREGVVNTSPRYQEASEVLFQVEAAAEMMEGVCETLRMAYFVANKVDGGTPHHAISGGTGSDDPGALTEQERQQEFVEQQSSRVGYKNTGFGPPKL